MEPELWSLLRRLSLVFGCKSHPDAGSASEAARRFTKTAISIKRPNLKNVKGIEWNELYV